MAIRGMSTANMAVLLLGLLAMIQQSMQMSVEDPIIQLKTDSCENIVKVRFGLILNSDTDEKVLLDSRRFKPDKDKPFVDLVGRRFHFGTLDNKTLIVYVKTGAHSVNVATTVQILLDKYPSTWGIISFGTAGSLNQPKLKLRDVSVPTAVAFTGNWLWEKFRGRRLKLVFGGFNFPRPGENLLGSVDFQNITLFSKGQKPKSVFWLNTTASWYAVAQRVLKPPFHLPGNATVAFGLKGSTSDFYVRNKAYGDFLHKTFNASYADTGSAAIALTSLSNKKPFISFRGVSNVAGGASSTPQVSYLASRNAFLAAAKVIDALPRPRVDCV